MVDVVTKEELTLTPEQVDTLKSLSPDITWLERELAKMKRAGLDTGDFEEKLEKLKRTREGLLREYSPT